MIGQLRFIDIAKSFHAANFFLFEYREKNKTMQVVIDVCLDDFNSVTRKSFH